MWGEIFLLFLLAGWFQPFVSEKNILTEVSYFFNNVFWPAAFFSVPFCCSLKSGSNRIGIYAGF